MLLTLAFAFVAAFSVVNLSNDQVAENNVFFVAESNVAFAATSASKPGCTYSPGSSCGTKCNDVALPENKCSKSSRVAAEDSEIEADVRREG